MKTMLESQERAFNSALEIVVQQMNDQINKLEDKVRDLTASLEFTQKEVDDLKNYAKVHEQEKKETKTKINQLTDEVKVSNIKNKELEDKINKQEDYSRRKNVRITGMKESGGTETWEQTAASVTSLLENKMQLSGLVLERAHRVGPLREGKPRPIVARFLRYCDREAVLRNRTKLKGINIYVNEDLCAASQAVKSAQFPQMREAKAQGKIAFFRHTKLIIKERIDNASAGRVQPPAREEGAVGGTFVGTEVAGVWRGDAVSSPVVPQGAGSLSKGAGGGDAVSSPVARQVAGACYSGAVGRGRDALSSSVARPSGSRSQSPAVPPASSQGGTGKMNLRKSTKK